MIEHRPDRASPWRARVRTPDGRTLSKSFKRKVDAEAWEDSQRTDMRRGEWVDPRSGDLTLSEWLADVTLSKINVSETWLKTRGSLIRNHIDPHIGVYPINRLTAEVVQRWVTDRSKVLAPETVRKLYAIVSEALTLAVGRGRLVRSPLIEIELPSKVHPEHRYLTEPELLALADAISPRYRPFVLLGGYGGLRPGEALRSEWRDLTGKFLQVRGTKTAGSRRTVRLPQVVLDGLADHRQEFPHLQLILHNQAGRPVDERRFRSRQFARAVQASVGEPMRPYDLRHTHVGLLIAQGAHAKVIADRLGHSTIRTTMDTYGHLLEGVESDVVDRLGEGHAPHTRPKRSPSEAGSG